MMNQQLQFKTKKMVDRRIVTCYESVCALSSMNPKK